MVEKFQVLSSIHATNSVNRIFATQPEKPTCDPGLLQRLVRPRTRQKAPRPSRSVCWAKLSAIVSDLASAQVKPRQSTVAQDEVEARCRMASPGLADPLTRIPVKEHRVAFEAVSPVSLSQR